MNDLPPMTRRTALTGAAAAAALALTAPSAAARPEDAKRSRLGLTMWACRFVRRQRIKAGGPDIWEPLRFLEYCREVGAGGMHIRLRDVDDATAEVLRTRLKETGMFLDAVVTLPGPEARETERFAAEMRTAARSGASAARTTLFPGRRYEEFHSVEAFDSALAEGLRRLVRGVPFAEAAGVPLALENHKDQRLDARVALFKEFDSPFVRACLDTGNNIALLDDPYETAEALAPFAASVHLKDQSLAPTPDGFLLGDVPLGAGSLDLPRLVRTIREAWPEARFSLELITRDALRVPCLTDGYHASFPTLPARDLARTLRLVRARPTQGQQIASLSVAERVDRETANVHESLQYARQELNL